jgi:hypothetical protein
MYQASDGGRESNRESERSAHSSDEYSLLAGPPYIWFKGMYLFNV